MLKRVTAPNRELPPRNEQFLSDFEQLQGQFAVSINLNMFTSSHAANHILKVHLFSLFLPFTFRTGSNYVW